MFMFIFWSIWLVVGWVGRAVCERIMREEQPGIAIIAGPFTFLVATIFFIADYTERNKLEPSKLRKWIRGF